MTMGHSGGQCRAYWTRERPIAWPKNIGTIDESKSKMVQKV